MVKKNGKNEGRLRGGGSGALLHGLKLDVKEVNWGVAMYKGVALLGGNEQQRSCRLIGKVG